MSNFDLSVLKTLEENFKSLKSSVVLRDTEIEKTEREIQEIQKKIDDLNSEKLNKELILGNVREEKLKLQTLYDKTLSEYENVKKCANKLLELFQ